MSAIAGIYYLDNRQVDRTDLVKMTDTLAHRGPDGSNVWSEGAIGLGHRMLWTTPESLLETLPLVNETGDLVITADARIDNREELIVALELTQLPAEKITDSYLILAAYERWGEQCPERLLGDFAFAIWDGRKQELFGARDHFGIKPFYYYCSDKTFIFATEIKALFCLPEVPRQLNEVKVGEFIVSNFDDTTNTFYQDILRLSPANSIKVSYTGTHLSYYWSLDLSREIKLNSDEEYAEAFRQLFTEAVRCRLRSAFPIGSMLSGGLDSSSIACVAKNLLSETGNTPLPTFSAIFDKVTECDERLFQNAVLSQGGFEPHYFHADQVGPFNNIDSVLWHQDQALSAGNLFLNCGLYEIANQRGVRIILDGFDGDSTVSHGVGYLHELAIQGHWLTLAKELQGYAKNFNFSYRKVLWSYLLRYSSLKKMRSIWQRLIKRIRVKPSPSANQSVGSEILNPKFVERIGLKEHLKSLKLSKPNALIQTERGFHYLTLTRGVMPHTLETLDAAAAGFSIELRFPFWDKRLVEFCLALPPNQKIQNGWTRLVMRRAMTDILPKEVQWRAGKSDMSHNFIHGLLHFDRHILDELIMHNSEVSDEYFKIDTLQETYKELISHRKKNNDTLALWKAAVLVFWLRQTHLDLKGGDVI